MEKYDAEQEEEDASEGLKEDHLDIEGAKDNHFNEYNYQGSNGLSTNLDYVTEVPADSFVEAFAGLIKLTPETDQRQANLEPKEAYAFWRKNTDKALSIVSASEHILKQTMTVQALNLSASADPSILYLRCC